MCIRDSHNVYSSMSAVPIAIIYIVANIALAVHIFHGAWSMFQTLGINNPKYNDLRKNIARGLAGLILIGNLSFPLAVQFGLIDEDNRADPIGFTHEGDAGEDGHSDEGGE